MILKFLQKGTILYYSSDEKYDGEIAEAESVWLTVLKIGPHSVLQGAQSHISSMVGHMGMATSLAYFSLNFTQK